MLYHAISYICWTPNKSLHTCDLTFFFYRYKPRLNKTILGKLRQRNEAILTEVLPTKSSKMVQPVSSAKG